MPIWKGDHDNTRKPRRDRVKIPIEKVDPLKVPLTHIDPYKMQSSAKGRGREMCIKNGKHDWVRIEHDWYMQYGGKCIHYVIFCRLCGEFGRTHDKRYLVCEDDDDRRR